jgi:hypothetical protein
VRKNFNDRKEETVYVQSMRINSMRVRRGFVRRTTGRGRSFASRKARISLVLTNDYTEKEDKDLRKGVEDNLDDLTEDHQSASNLEELE